jgi:hypothetical protein
MLRITAAALLSKSGFSTSGFWEVRRERNTGGSYPEHRIGKPIYDVDTRWNSAYDMIVQYLELEAEYTDFCNSHSQVKCLLLTAEEIVSDPTCARASTFSNGLALPRQLETCCPALLQKIEKGESG